MKSKKFTVVIPVYRDWERLLLCLDALKKQQFNVSDFEILVVNNDQTNEVPDEISGMEDVKIIHEPKPGSYAARNQGAVHANGDILAFIDADCIPDEYWLQNAKLHFEQKKCDLLGGNIEIFRPEGGSNSIYIYEKQYLFIQQKNVSKGRSVTANLFVNKSAFEAVGGFDETIKSMGDFEFTERCVSAGYSIVYGRNVSVRHPARNSLKAYLKRRYRIVCWKEIIANKNAEKRNVYHKNRELLIQFLVGMKKAVTRKSKTGRFKDTILIKYVTFVTTLFETGVRISIQMGFVNPSRARE